MSPTHFHLVDPDTLIGFEDWAMWLEALLHNPCGIFEDEDELVLLGTKQLVQRLNGLKIEIYPNEHPPPHFHVKSPEVDATFAIEDCRLLSGFAPAQAKKKVRYWHQRSKHILVQVWNETRPLNCVVGAYGGA
jgi:Domain of unknown function (DUF4160)